MTTDSQYPQHAQRSLAAGARRTLLIRLGSRLRRARTQASLTQSQAAQIVGLTAQTIHNWETARNEPPPHAISVLAKAYNTTEEALLEDLNAAFGPPLPPDLRFTYDRVQIVGQKLSEARKAAGYTQEQISEITGLSPSAIRRYERNIANPTTRTLQALAGAYNQDAGHFTARGHFTDEEQERFDASTTLRLGSDIDPVLAAYNLAKPDLSEDAQQKIVNYIKIIHDHSTRAQLTPRNISALIPRRSQTRTDSGNPPSD